MYRILAVGLLTTSSKLRWLALIVLLTYISIDRKAVATTNNVCDRIAHRLWFKLIFCIDIDVRFSVGLSIDLVKLFLKPSFSYKNNYAFLLLKWFICTIFNQHCIETCARRRLVFLCNSKREFIDNVNH